jgi:hypothetical protein
MSKCSARSYTETAMEGSMKFVVGLLGIGVLVLWFAIALAAATYDITTGKKRPWKHRVLALLEFLPFCWF